MSNNENPNRDEERFIASVGRFIDDLMALNANKGIGDTLRSPDVDIEADLATRPMSNKKYALHNLFSICCIELGIYSINVSMFIKNKIRDSQYESERVRYPERLEFIDVIMDSDEKPLPIAYCGIYNTLISAIIDKELSVLPSGLFSEEAVKSWVSTCGIDLKFFRDKNLMEGDQEQVTTEPHFSGETPAMVLTRKGLEYWWGGIDRERQWRGNLSTVAEWFKERGGGTQSEAMGRIIAPSWVLKEGGGGYRSREQVPLPDNS